MIVFNVDIDIEKCKLALVGDGYLLEEVNEMTDEKIIQIWEDRIERIISCSYHKGKRCGMY